MRIDKYISDAANITRSQARKLISAGRVRVDGCTERSPSEHVDAELCRVSIDGNELKYTKYVYIMMNKPSGVLSATADRHAPTALDLLRPEDRRSGLFIAGRLDKDTTGFLLITDDGDFAHRLLSPKNHIYKKYRARLAHGECDGYAEAFSQGVTLADGYECKSAHFEQLDGTDCTLEICEGKFHQIKRMFLALGNEVLALERVSMADVELDKSLAPGEYRYLTQQEYELFLNKITKN